MFPARCSELYSWCKVFVSEAAVVHTATYHSSILGFASHSNNQGKMMFK